MSPPGRGSPDDGVLASVSGVPAGEEGSVGAAESAGASVVAADPVVGCVGALSDDVVSSSDPPHAASNRPATTSIGPNARFERDDDMVRAPLPAPTVRRGRHRLIHDDRHVKTMIVRSVSSSYDGGNAITYHAVHVR
jgi:hypothetical protein